MSGGFFLSQQQKILGEVWREGTRNNSVDFTAPWHRTRGSLHICPTGLLQIDSRQNLPYNPTGDLLQAGPMLVRDSINLIAPGDDNEGFSAASEQFDSDITVGRHPRAVIGVTNKKIICLVADGRSDTDDGLSLSELADLMISLGAIRALNLDGGSSASLISKGRLINKPRGPRGDIPLGRPIHSAITFECVN